MSVSNVFAEQQEFEPNIYGPAGGALFNSSMEKSPLRIHSSGQSQSQRGSVPDHSLLYRLEARDRLPCTESPGIAL